jgi:hypothetical protein
VISSPGGFYFGGWGIQIRRVDVNQQYAVTPGMEDVFKACTKLLSIQDGKCIKFHGLKLQRFNDGYRFEMPGRGRNEDWSNKYKSLGQCVIDAKAFAAARAEWMKAHPGVKIFQIKKIA